MKITIQVLAKTGVFDIRRVIVDVEHDREAGQPPSHPAATREAAPMVFSFLCTDAIADQPDVLLHTASDMVAEYLASEGDDVRG